MTSDGRKTNDPADSAGGTERDLRALAEAGLREAGAHDLEDSPVEDAGRLLHELRVHQIELEKQNDELRRAQEELERSHARFVQLYDGAPVAYLTVSEADLILEVAAELGISPRMVTTHQARVLRKLGLDTKAEMIRYVTEHRLTIG